MNVAENEIAEQNSGWRIEQMLQMSVMYVYRSSIAAVWVPVEIAANAIKVDFGIVHCVTERQAAYILTVENDLSIFSMTYLM